LPAPIVNGRGDSIWKWKDLQLSRARDLDLGSGHIAYRHASLNDLYPHAKFHWNQKNYLWTDGRTSETHFIRSTQKCWPIKHVTGINKKMGKWEKRKTCTNCSGDDRWCGCYLRDTCLIAMCLHVYVTYFRHRLWNSNAWLYYCKQFTPNRPLEYCGQKILLKSWHLKQ